ncbi:invasion protein IalB [Chelatococcus caeni]|uniref:Invasion protein IalB n=1 Tax=Chelatococcus caeni TaxID=1348468 RepID=A0A840BWW2_9HYPH|nr:invasion associated locus B family protein [Chelatococcus caeni]MBB4017440.1 invasion protein IalB [Chelatococcus caeni]
MFLALSSRVHVLLPVVLAAAFGAGLDRSLAAPAVERFDDWEVHCGEGTGATAAAKGNCKAVQRLAVKDSGETVFLLTVLPDAGGKGLVGIVSVPLGGYLAPGIELRIDGRKPYKLLVETCNASGCHAGFALAGNVLAQMKAGDKAVFRVWTAKEKPADVTVSLAGFTKAIGALDGPAR